MERPFDSCEEILDRLSPILRAVFNAYRVPEERSRKIVEEACFTLVAKRRLMHEDPEGWLLRTIVEICRRPAKERTVEDPPE
jgi:hypothetical protein